MDSVKNLVSELESLHCRYCEGAYNGCRGCTVYEDIQKIVEKYVDLFNQEEDLENCDESEIIYDNTQDAYICSNCGTYIVDRVDSKDINYRFPKSCSECHCEF